MTMGLLILIILMIFAIFALFSPSVGSTESNTVYESQEELKHQEERKRIKSQFLSQNSDFINLILTTAFSEGSKKNPRILSLDKAKSNRVRTVFIGCEDMYVFAGEPYDSAFNLVTDRIEHFLWPYPKARSAEVLLHIDYANDLCYTSIDDYHGISKHDVLGWIAEDIRDEFQAIHPDIKVEMTNWTLHPYHNYNCYYNFTYEIPAIQLSGWK